MGVFRWLKSKKSQEAEGLMQDYDDLDASKDKFIKAILKFEDLFKKFNKKFLAKPVLTAKEEDELINLKDNLIETSMRIAATNNNFTKYVAQTCKLVEKESYGAQISYDARHRKLTPEQAEAEAKRDTIIMMKRLVEEYERGNIQSKQEFNEMLNSVQRLSRKGL